MALYIGNLSETGYFTGLISLIYIVPREFREASRQKAIRRHFR
jgi:hypothetical protein